MPPINFQWNLGLFRDGEQCYGSGKKVNQIDNGPKMRKKWKLEIPLHFT